MVINKVNMTFGTNLTVSREANSKLAGKFGFGFMDGTAKAAVDLASNRAADSLRLSIKKETSPIGQTQDHLIITYYNKPDFREPLKEMSLPVDLFRNRLKDKKEVKEFVLELREFLSTLAHKNPLEMFLVNKK